MSYLLVKGGFHPKIRSKTRIAALSSSIEHCRQCIKNEKYKANRLERKKANCIHRHNQICKVQEIISEFTTVTAYLSQNIF